jgi:hypothetical protein
VKVIDRTTLERITIIYSPEEKDEVQSFLDTDRYHTVFRGPVIDFPNVDANKLEVVAEREVYVEENSTIIPEKWRKCK